MAALRDGKPVLVRLPEIAFVNDKVGKPVGIEQHNGRRPIAAFGNSDVTSRCSNGRPLVPVHVWAFTSITTMPNANKLMTASRPSTD